MKHRLISHVLIITIIFGSMYGLLQQFGRMQANDMPELLATQAAKQLDAGLGLSSINMGATNLANSPVPFVIVYDKKSKPLAGSGYLDSKLAQMPVGVVNHAKPGKPHAVTWAPRSGVRIASVTVATSKGNYFVVGGQSLKQTENHAATLFRLTLIAYGMALFVAFATAEFHRRWVSSVHGQCECPPMNSKAANTVVATKPKSKSVSSSAKASRTKRK